MILNICMLIVDLFCFSGIQLEGMLACAFQWVLLFPTRSW